jgi:hypothetical protein
MGYFGVIVRVDFHVGNLEFLYKWAIQPGFWSKEFAYFFNTKFESINDQEKSSKLQKTI